MKNFFGMKTFLWGVSLVSIAGFVGVSHAQDDNPFEDLSLDPPASESAAPENVSPSATDTAETLTQEKGVSNTAQQASADEASTETGEELKKTTEANSAADFKDSLSDDLEPLEDDFDGITENDLSEAAESSVTNGTQKASPEDDLDSYLDNGNEVSPQTGGIEENPDEGVRDILEPDQKIAEPEGEFFEEDSLQPEKAEVAEPETPEALKAEPEVFSSLDPSDELARIPLRPAMSDENWRKYAGPSLDKIYRIRKNDTLWAISERLFGNPYLWPKVWQLNAQFGNPHQIDPGIDLEFFLGNPNSAPVLALRSGEGTAEFLPLFNSNQPLSFLEEIEASIRAQGSTTTPPFKHFLVEEVPEELSTIPRSTVDGRLMFTEGDKFVDEELNDGEYSIVRLQSLKARGAPKVSFSGYRLKLLGVIRVKNKLATIVSAYEEIQHLDSIILQKFEVPLLSLREEKLGDDASRVLLAPLEEGTSTSGISAYRSIGLRFPSSDSGPQVGSLLSFGNKVGELGTLLIVNRSGRLATGWLVGSTREITAKDKLQ